MLNANIRLVVYTEGLGQELLVVVCMRGLCQMLFVVVCMRGLCLMLFVVVCMRGLCPEMLFVVIVPQHCMTRVTEMETIQVKVYAALHLAMKQWVMNMKTLTWTVWGILA